MTAASQPNDNSKSNVNAIIPAVKDKEAATRLRLPRYLPFLWLAAAGLCGSLAAHALDWPAWAFLVLSITSAILVLATKLPAISSRLPILSLPLLLAVFAFTGFLYCRSLPGNGPAALPSYHYCGNLTLKATLVKPPSVQTRSQALTVRVDSLRTTDGLSIERPKGLLLLQLPQGQSFRYGDQVLVCGELENPPEGSSFSYRSYLAHHGIYSYLPYGQVTKIASGAGHPLLQMLDRLRNRSAAVLDILLPHPENALLRGILLGDESAIPKALEEAYALTGTAHIIAISGFNMAVLAGLIARLFQKSLGPYLGLLLTILVLGLYSLLVGASASVLRAALMGCVAAIGQSLGRRGSGLNALGFSVLIMLLINPHLPWDIGFQLSAMATLGLLLFARPSQAHIELWISKFLSEGRAKWWAKQITELFAITLIAQGMVLPLLAFHFRSLSPLFMLANPAILWLQPAVMVFGLAAMLAGMLFLPLGKLLAWAAWLPACFTNRVIVFFAQLMPNAWTLPRFSVVWVLLVYTFAALLLLDKPALPLRKKLFSPALVFSTVSLAVVLAWIQLTALPSGRLELRLLGSQSTPLVHLRLPDGQSILVGTSLPARSLALKASSFSPGLNKRLDLLLIPSCKANHLRAYAELPDQIRIKQVLWACNPHKTVAGQRLAAQLSDKKIQSLELSAQQAIVFGNEGRIIFDLAKSSLEALEIRYGQQTMRLQFLGKAPPQNRYDLLLMPNPNSLQEGTRICIMPSAALHDCQEYILSPGAELQLSSDGFQFYLH